MNRPAILRAIPIWALLGGCIASPPWETGATPKAKALDYPVCSDTAVIEDAEDGDNRTIVQDGRGGYWFTFTDSNGSRIEPQGSFTMSSPGRAGSKGAARMHGKIGTIGEYFYAGMGVSIADPRGPYDASDFSGVSFWAKGPGRIRFEMPDGNTAPEGGVCKDCYNDFGIYLSLEADWQRYTIPFEWLSQRSGWGEPHPELDQKRVIAMEWEFNGAGRDFDIWIDDIAFVCNPEDYE
jgi:hypothetical protein